MTRLRRTLALGALFVGLALCAASPTRSDVFTAEQRNLQTLLEAVIMDASKLVTMYGMDSGATLDVSGSYDVSGWSATPSGTYRGAALSVGYSATYVAASDSGSHASTGTFGGFDWDGTATWSFTQDTPTRELMDWDSEVVSYRPPAYPPQPPPPVVHDRHMIGKINEMFPIQGGTLHTDTGIYHDTIEGKIQPGEKYQLSQWIEQNQWVSGETELPADGVTLSGGAPTGGGAVTAQIAFTALDAPALSVCALGALVAGLLALGGGAATRARS